MKTQNITNSLYCTYSNLDSFLQASPEALLLRHNNDFNRAALEVFSWQAQYCEPYRQFLDLLHIQPTHINHWEAIPFLPISLFKTHQIKTGHWKAAVKYTSSGTTQVTTSQHFIKSEERYLAHARLTFEHLYGPIKNRLILGLLPSYLEREGSSLVAMVESFITHSERSDSGFYLRDFDRLAANLNQAKNNSLPPLLIGVTYALMDFADAYEGLDLSQVIVMETGGMKGTRPEWIRADVHQYIAERWQVSAIHSEYGMTEMQSQAYAMGGEKYTSAEGLRVLIRDLTDPMRHLPLGRTGGLDIVDLCNTQSCAFIATDDIGRSFADNRFEVLGRTDSSDIRGCNLLSF